MNCVNCGHCVCSHRAKKLVASAAKCQCPDRKDERPCQLGSGAAGRKDAGEGGTWEKRMCFSGYNAADTHNFTAGAYRRQNLNHWHCVRCLVLSLAVSVHYVCCSVCVVGTLEKIRVK